MGDAFFDSGCVFFGLPKSSGRGNQGGVRGCCQLPMMLNDIGLKLPMRARVLNLSARLKKCLDTIQISWWLHMATYIVVDELQFQISLILNDLVLRNDTCRRNVVEGFLVPITSRTTNNLQNTKISFNILSACFLYLGKFNLFFILALGWSSQMLTTTNRGCRQDNSPPCNHSRSRCSCKSEHHR
jgi:hypothetical protein